MPAALTHRRRAFELTIASSLALPELAPAPATGAADVVVERGPVAERLDDGGSRVVLDDVTFEASPHRCLIRLPSGTRFLVEHGERITVDARPGTSDQEVRAYVIGSCLGAVLHQRGLIVLHGSAIDTPGGAVLFVGDSGKGKSSIAAAFCARGHRLISDDICAVRLDASRRPVVLPAYPQLKLCPDALPGLEGRGDVRSRDGDKHVVTIDGDTVDEPRPILAIIHLRTFHVDRVSMTRLPRAASVRVIARHIYRKCFLPGLAIGMDHAARVADLAAVTPVYRTIRPRQSPSLRELTDEIAGVLDAAGQTDPDDRVDALDLNSRLGRSRSAVSARVGDRLVMTQLDHEQYFELDPVGVRVWELLASPRTVAELSAQLLDEYDVSRADCERDLRALLTALHTHQLIQAVP